MDVLVKFQMILFRNNFMLSRSSRFQVDFRSVRVSPQETVPSDVTSSTMKSTEKLSTYLTHTVGPTMSNTSANQETTTAALLDKSDSKLTDFIDNQTQNENIELLANMFSESSMDNVSNLTDNRNSQLRSLTNKVKSTAHFDRTTITFQTDEASTLSFDESVSLVPSGTNFPETISAEHQPLTNSAMYNLGSDSTISTGQLTSTPPSFEANVITENDSQTITNSWSSTLDVRIKSTSATSSWDDHESTMLVFSSNMMENKYKPSSESSPAMSEGTLLASSESRTANFENVKSISLASSVEKTEKPSSEFRTSSSERMLLASFASSTSDFVRVMPSAAIRLVNPESTKVASSTIEIAKSTGKPSFESLLTSNEGTLLSSFGTSFIDTSTSAADLISSTNSVKGTVEISGGTSKHDVVSPAPGDKMTDLSERAKETMPSTALDIIEKISTDIESSPTNIFSEQGLSSYITKVVRTRREATSTVEIIPKLDISTETEPDVSGEYSSNTGASLSQSEYVSDHSSASQSQVTQGDNSSSRYSGYENSQSEDMTYPFEFPSFEEEEDFLSSFLDFSSDFHSESEYSLMWDFTPSIDIVPYGSMSGSFTSDLEDMQPSETLFEGRERTATQMLHFSDSYGFTSFEPQSSWSFNERISSGGIVFPVSQEQQYSSYFNVMGTIQSPGFPQYLSSPGPWESVSSSQPLPLSVDDMRNTDDLSPSLVFSFNAAATGLVKTRYPESQTYATRAFAFSPGSRTEHISQEVATSSPVTSTSTEITSGINTENWKPSSSFSESSSTSIDSMSSSIPAQPTTTSQQPPFQLPYLGNSCLRHYPRNVFDANTAANRLPKINICDCPHFACKLPPPPILPTKPPRFGRRPDINYLLTKLMYRNVVRNRLIMWEQAKFWDNANVTQCPLNL